MLYFVDSSALVKLFLNEHESTAMARFVEGVPVAALLCSRLALLETQSAIRRKQLFRQITLAYASKAMKELQLELSRWSILPVNEDVLVRAGSVIHEHGLRTLDAIQLASAVLMQHESPVTSRMTPV